MSLLGAIQFGASNGDAAISGPTAAASFRSVLAVALSSASVVGQGVLRLYDMAAGNKLVSEVL